MLAQWSYQNQSKIFFIKFTFENQYCSHINIQRYIDAKVQ